MISIGEFARYGRVSVRMLRHYDAIGLLSPDQVDPVTGYRAYHPEQVQRLNRIVALKELGLRLEQVGQIVDDRLDGAALAAMLRLRKAELEAQLAEGSHRLARVEARLRLIDCEATMTDPHITTKTVPTMTHLGLRGVAASATQADVGPVVSGMYPQLIDLLGAAGAQPIGPSVAYYTPAPEQGEDALTVFATFPVPTPSVPGLEPVTIPAGQVASLIHLGSMDSVDVAYQTLHRWVREHGYTASGDAREIYLEVPDDTAEWVTEIQLDYAERAEQH